MVLHSKKATRRHVMATSAPRCSRLRRIRSAAGPDQDAGDRRLGAAHRRGGGNRPQRQQRLHHRRDLHQRRAGRRRDRRREVQDRAEAVRRRQRPGARHDADPAPDRRGHQLLPGLVRLQHRAADRGDHRARQEADGADRRRLRRDLHHAATSTSFGMFPRATRQFAATAALFKTLQPAAADLFGDLDQRRLLQDRGRGRAAVLRRGGLQAASRATSCRPSRPTCRACWPRCAPTRRTCWSASCTTRIRS